MSCRFELFFLALVLSNESGSISKKKKTARKNVPLYTNLSHKQHFATKQISLIMAVAKQVTVMLNALDFKYLNLLVEKQPST